MKQNSMNWAEFQQKKWKQSPNYLAVYLVNHCAFTQVIDLGCGSGNETVYLVKKGKQVLAIDAEIKEDYIASRLTEKQMKQVTIEQSNFENIHIPQTECILALFSLPFCEPSSFVELWNKIESSLKSGGILAANLFGERDWHNSNQEVSTFTKSQVEELLKDFEILKWKEQEYTSATDEHHWHYYDFVVMKR